MDFHDPVSAGTHLFTAIWAAFAALMLNRLTRGHGIGRWAVGVHGASMVILYLASGLFHGVRHDTIASFQLYQKIDKSAIFLLIAGSYVPVFVYLSTGWLRKGCLLAMAVVTAIGIGALWLLPDMPHSLLVFIYVFMGLIGLAPGRIFFRTIGWRGMLWVATFASSYVGGAIIEVAKWPVIIPGYFGPHELLHISDTLGTVIHFIFIVKYVIVRRPPRDPVCVVDAVRETVAV